MKQLAIFLVIGIVFVSSCKKVTNTTDLAPVPTGAIEGFVILNDEFGNTLSNSSGVTVSLDSTSYSTVTDSNGRFVLKNIPGNTHYNFTYNKSGYPSFHAPNFQFILVGGSSPFNPTSNNILPLYDVSLYPISTTTVQSLSAVPSKGYITLSANITNANPAFTASSTVGVQLFMSTEKNVSSTNYQSSLFIGGAGSNPVTVESTFESEYSNYPTGTTLYFIAYGTSSSDAPNFQSVTTGQNVYTNLNATASAIVSAVTE